MDFRSKQLFKDVAKDMVGIRPLEIFRLGVAGRVGTGSAPEVGPKVGALVRVVGPAALVGGAQLVVRSSSGRIRKFKVGVGDGLELDGRGSPPGFVGRSGGDPVGVALEGFALVRSLDLVKGCGLVDACGAEAGSVSSGSRRARHALLVLRVVGLSLPPVASGVDRLRHGGSAVRLRVTCRT